MKLLRKVLCLMLVMSVCLIANNYTVTTGNGTGTGSLYLAVIDANNHVGPDTIEFDIQSMSDPPYYLFLEYSIPAFTDNGTFINGFSQEGSQPNSGQFGEPYNAVFNLIFDGQYIDSILYVFTLESDSNEICGISFMRMKADTLVKEGPILIDGGGYNHIWGCSFGLDLDGITDAGNRGNVVTMRNGAHDNLVGGNIPEERCVFGGNDGANIYIEDPDSDNNTISGNYIGTDTTGAAAPRFVGATGYGVYVQGGSQGGPAGTIIGGEDSTYANVFAGLPQQPIFIQTLGDNGGKIMHNWIGVGADGDELSNGGPGITLDKGTEGDSVINNWIAFNEGQGVLANDTNSNGHVIMGNTITDNEHDGVSLYGQVQDCLVKQNEIARNVGNGVYVAGPASDRNRISENSIYENDSLGIDLAPRGVTANDGNDNDDGPNQNMNYPSLDSASTTRVYGRLQGNFREGATIEAFIASEGNNMYGEGMTYLGTGTADDQGYFEVITTPSTIGDYVTVTATDTEGNTSEFCKNIMVTKAGPGVEESEPVISPLTLLVGIKDNAVNFNYNLPRTCEAKLALYDVAGTVVTEITSGRHLAGNHSITINTSELSSGLYFARLSTVDHSVTTKFLIVQ